MKSLFLSILFLPAIAAAAVSSGSPRLVGDEVFVYSMDAVDHNQPYAGRVRDRSPNGYHGSYSLVQNVAGRHREAYNFQVNDYWISVPDSVTSNRPQGTLTMWVNLRSYTGGGKLFVKNNPGVSTEMGLIIDSTTGQLIFSTSQDGGSTALRSNTAVPLNSWTHIAVTWGSSGKRIYLNGVLDASNGDPVGVGSNSYYTYIGNDPNIPWGRGVDGLIDEVRFYSTVLNPYYINSLRTQPYWGSTNTAASAWLIGGEAFVYQMDSDDHDLPSAGKTRDGSPSLNHGTRQGVQFTASGRFNAAYNFNVVDNWISVPDDVTSNKPEGTLALWVNLRSYSGGVKLFVKNYPGVTTELGLILDSSTGIMGFSTSQNGGSTVLRSTRAIPLGRWVHLAVTWGPQGKRMYIDGALEAANNDPVGVGSASAYTFIGNDPNITYARGVDGVIDEVRFYSAALRPLDLQAVATLPYR